MKILLAGANGQVAFDIIRLSNQSSIHCIAPTETELDITDSHKIKQAIQQHQPDVLVNAAAYTAVDKAETNIDLAYKINEMGPYLLANACAEFNIPLIHISTNYVFDGTQNKPYKETDTPNPINIYGQSKLAGEQAIINTLPQHIILRTSAVFGVHGHNFVKTVLKLAQTQETLKMIHDQIINPTPALDLAQVILTLCQSLPNHPKYGIYHYGGTPETSWCELAKNTIEIIWLEIGASENLKVKAITPINTTAFPTPAKRPLYSALNCDKITTQFGIKQQPWQTSLKTMLEELTKQK